MKTAAFIISWVITQLVLASICYISYIILLKDLIGTNVSFLNWLGIVIIASCVIPSGRIIKPGTEQNKTPDNGFKSLMEKYTNGR